MKSYIAAALLLLHFSCTDSASTGEGSGSASSSSTTDPTTQGSTDAPQTDTQSSASGGLEGTSDGTSTTGPGVDSTSGGCEPQTEICNGVDDDCNDEIDEGFDVGARCELGVGACAAPGVLACEERGGTICNATPGKPTPESCNRIDDDCNGVVDDLGGACMVGIGACEAMGTQICVDGMPACDATPGPPTAELCNGIDDDCNGVVDDAQLGACEDQMGACGFLGSLDCTGACIGSVPPGGMLETCNGVDDDCDGGIDENLIFSPCAGGGGICTCFESDANGDPQGAGPFDAYRTCAPGGGFFFWLCDPALGCSDYPAGCTFGGFHP